MTKSQYFELKDLEEPTNCLEPPRQWMPSSQHPYPMNFVQAPSLSYHNMISYNGKPYLQGLSINKGPIIYPSIEKTCNPKNGWERKHTIFPKNESAIVYPSTHSIPGPLIQSYIALPNKMYPY